MSENILKIEKLEGYYRGTFGVVHAVDNVSFSVKKGDILGIAGESGCGKSTLAELITGFPMPLLHHEKGQVYVKDFPIYLSSSQRKNLMEDSELLRKEIAERKEKVRSDILCKIIGYVPQASQNSLNPVKRIKNFVLDVMEQRVGNNYDKKERDKEEILKRVKEHFKTLGLDEEVLDKFPHELSGGMKQRVVIGISTLWNPSLLILDEPTSALDVTTQELLLQLFRDLKKKKIVDTILFISHDIPTLAQICDTCLIMYAGKVVEIATMEDIINDPQHPYTQKLISSLACFKPDGSAETKLEGIPGRPPDLRNPPKGCRFFPRCSARMEKCKENYPNFFFPKNSKNPVACWLYENGGKEI